MEQCNFSNFDIQFGEDPNSELNNTLKETLISFNLQNLTFKVGIIDNKLQPFDACSKLIKVKKINVYLKVLAEDGETVVGTFKIENCQFLKITNFQDFLNHFTKGFGMQYAVPGLATPNGQYVMVSIDHEAVLFNNDLILAKKDNKTIQEMEELRTVKKKGSPFEDDYVKKASEPGLVYGQDYSADYSAQFTRRSLVDKAYVDAAIEGYEKAEAPGELVMDAGDNGMRIRNAAINNNMPQVSQAFFGGFQSEVLVKG